MLRCDVRDAAHELLMLALRVVDHARWSAARCAASVAVSPGWFMPISTAAARCASRRPSSGERQADLIVEIACAWRTRDRRQTRRAGWPHVISLTVVFPLLPTMAATGSAKQRRQYAASAASAASGSATASRLPLDATLEARRRDRAGDDRCRPRHARTPRNEVVTVEALALQCDEQTRPDLRARESVATPLNATLPPKTVASHGARGGCRIHHRALRDARARAA